MKRILSVIVFLIVVAFSINAMAAGAIVITRDVSVSGVRVVEITATSDAAGAPFADIALDSIPRSSGVPKMSFAGWWLFKIDSLFGATPVTADSDLYIWSTLDKIDILGGNGMDKVDDNTNNQIYPATSTQPLLGDEILDVDNTTDNNAVHTFKIRLYQ